MAAEPWQTAEIPGPKKALVITKPEVVAAMIKRAKHPVLVVGYRAAEIEFEGGKLVDFIIEFSGKSGIPVVATAHMVSEFSKRGFKPASFMPAVDIGNRLVDPSWSGVDGKGQHDLALFVGLPYYMEWTILSGLKHFAQHLKTITLDNVYQPHANWSFPNISHEDWVKSLKVIIEKFEGGEKE
ncbi:MAG: CO dehydrogenase/acetyl-CoA synthase complex subunit epsilon [Candidatus Bathyarchaeota archaeon]|jgi:acetyl-CoA decarbonylase/synthase complex subunit epsilon|nr:CO dehydrogenase/acetyl-CoA synthase complex subunit epsilon [Candidatus Bathyarchaeota archaeon A05DMB-3]MDH7607488.1 CO dehydrogenase/acetyl-CoA synthase complex subunit epsilon [Candidatus Bathyarchaeota archaeon]